MKIVVTSLYLKQHDIRLLETMKIIGLIMSALVTNSFMLVIRLGYSLFKNG